MQLTLALAALAATTVYADCTTTSYSGKFQLGSQKVSSPTKRSLKVARDDCEGITLADGVLTDFAGRTGEIVSNYQFQFDNPVQEGNLATSGFSLCSNNSLALNGNAVFWECYDLTRTVIYSPDLTPVSGNCYQAYLPIIPCGSTESASAGVTQISDGQPEVTSCVPVTEMVDGQPVVSSCPTTSACVPVTEMKDGQPVVSSCPTTSTCVPVTEMKDGQPVVSSCPTAVVTPTCVPVTEMKDGQPVVSPCPVASTSVCVPVTEMKDGQPVVSPCPVASTSSVCVPVTEMKDGQPVVSACPGSSPVSVPANTTAAVSASGTAVAGSSVGTVAATTLATSPSEGSASVGASASATSPPIAGANQLSIGSQILGVLMGVVAVAFL